MCWAILPTLLSAGAAVLGATASMQQAQAQQSANEFNARVADQNAQAVEDQRQLTQDAYAIERRRLGERVAAERGALRARFAGMGLDAELGTPADLVGDVQRAYDLDLSITGRNETNDLRSLDMQEADYRNQAQLLRTSGSNAVKAGQIGAAGSLLDGASTVSGRWIQPSNDKGKTLKVGS